MVSVQQGEAFLQRLHRTTGKFFQSFTTIVDLGFLEDPESGPRWNEVAQNHVLLQTNQLVDFPSQCRFSQNFGCFLEGSSTDETVGLHGCFGDTKQLRTGRCTLWTFAFGNRSTKSLNLGIGLLKGLFRDDRILGEVAVTWVGDLDATTEFFICFTELEAVHDKSGQQAGITRGFDFHFTQHACDDDFAVLVVDLNLLRLVNLLDFVKQILLNGLFS